MDLKHPSARLIVSECNNEGLLRNQCAYVLATAWHETGAYKYMREIWGPTAAQKRYEGRKTLGNTVAGDGKKFMGRGFVQITGRRNYTDWSKRLGIDLVKEPSLAERPEIAVKILVKGSKLGTFTGKKLSDYITLSKSDFTNARRIINGTDKAKEIAAIARKYDELLKAEGYGVIAPVKTAPPAPAKPVLIPDKPSIVVVSQKGNEPPTITVKPAPAGPVPVAPTKSRTGLVALIAVIAAAIAAFFGWR